MISTEEANITEMVDCGSWEDFVVECKATAASSVQWRRTVIHYWDQIKQSTEAAVNVKVRYTEVAVRSEH